jgi:murein DD-endopeptidase MepM/ murein hydrolase activator NlpD
VSFSMKYISYIIALLTFSCGVQHRLQQDETATDDSYVYQLPYAEGKSYLVVQGYRSWFSHKGRLAYDFKMKTGTPVYAAREGVVTSVQEDFTKGGIGKKYYRKANSIVIRHEDGSNAMYAHLKHNGAEVKPGDAVKRGQLIGYSGNTGYSAFPHLHFLVWGPTKDGRRAQLPVRFQTVNGAKYLKPGRSYKSVNESNL